MSGAIAAIGTLLKGGNGASPETFTTVAEVLSVSGPSMTAETIDVTNHDSANATREFLTSFKDGGEVSFSINYIPSNATHKNATGGLLDAYVNRTLRNWQLVFPTSPTTTWSFAGLITAFSPTANIDTQLMADVTIKVSGQPTLA